MQVAMVKEGRVTPQMVYSERDLQWMLKSGWKRLESPAPIEAQPEVKPERNKPGRKPKVKQVSLMVGICGDG
jgi:hypothetical protein